MAPGRYAPKDSQRSWRASVIFRRYDQTLCCGSSTHPDPIRDLSSRMHQA
jgi:hypothetical protein